MRGIIINSDADGILSYIGREDALPTSADDIRNFPLEFEGSQVTDYFLNVAADGTRFPSERFTDVLDKFHRTVENGIPVDYSGNLIGRAAHIVFEELGVDHYQLMIEGLRRAGIHPWISFRMNDFHGRTPDAKTSFGFTDFYHEHPEYYLSHLPAGFQRLYRDRAFDYSEPAVREHYLGIIDEALSRYDCDGIELDFQRECFLFPYGKEYEGVEIMNGFLRRVDEILHRYETRYGHGMKIAVRVPADIQTCFDFGMDVVQWVREGIVDLVIPTSRWATTDTDIPVKLWSNMIKPYGAMLAPGIEYLFAPHPAAQQMRHNMETFAAFAASAYAQGADRIYLYNHFRTNIHQHFDKSAPPDYSPEKGFGDPGVYWTMINTVGDPAAVQKLNRRHIVTYTDMLAPWEQHFPRQQLPAVTERTCGFKLFVGDIPEGAEVILRLGAADIARAAENPPAVAVNADLCEYIGTEEDPQFAKATVLRYAVPPSVRGPLLCPRVAVSERTEFNYVEIYIKPV